jgi:hypothetical protein
VRCQHTFGSTVRDEEVIVAAVHDYGNVVGGGIRSEFVQEHHRSKQSRFSIITGKDLSNVKHTRDLNQVSTGYPNNLGDGDNSLGSSAGPPPNK